MGWIATAKDSTHPVRVMRFTVSSAVSYVLEVGNGYIRFYTSDARVGVSGVAAYNNAATYVPGNIISSAGVNYYCILTTIGHTPPNATYWYALTASVMEIKSPYLGSDIFNMQIAQSADVLYIACSGYAPRTLTLNAANEWVLALYVNTNGPFMPQNTDTTITLTPSATSGTITLSASKATFNSGQVGSIFELISTIGGQTITPQLTAAGKAWQVTKNTWQAITTGTWTGSIFIQTSPDNVNWTTVSTVTSNGTVSGSTTYTDGYLRAIMQSAVAFSGTASVALTGNGDVTGPTTIAAMSAATAAVPAGDTAVITLTNLTASGDTVQLQRSDDNGVSWVMLASYVVDQAATVVATAKTECLIRAQKSINGGGSPIATVDGTTGTAPKLTVSISLASTSAAIQAGLTWGWVTTGTWTGKILLQVSTDGGNNWNVIHSLANTSSPTNNENTTGQTGKQQCIIRVITDPSVAFTGTATVDLTIGSFDWIGVAQITVFTNSTTVTATVLSNVFSTNDSTGLANTANTSQWSEGAWSTYRGWPACVSFYQDRLGWSSTTTQPNVGWLTTVGFYTDFTVHSPIEDSDSISFILPGRQLNSILSMVQLLNTLMCLTSDAEYTIQPSSGSGPITPSNIDQQIQGHRGSASVFPAVVGAEIILMQQMGTVMRNLIFQLAVNGYFGDNISQFSQHLLTGFSVIEMAYQQEPDSILWIVRSDGQLISITYSRDQEMNAWTHHDTSDGAGGTAIVESACCIPNAALKINELWLVVNRSGTRYIEVLKPRDQSTDPKQAWFLDCATQYSGAATTTVTGIPLPNGTQVAVLADGNVVANPLNTNLAVITVQSGSITIPLAASTITVGLPFTSDVETLPLEIAAAGGAQGRTMQSRRTTIPKVVFRFLNSRGGYVMGTSQELSAPASGVVGMFQIFTRHISTNLNAAEPLESKDKQMNLNGGFDKQARIFFRQIDPLPFQINAIMPEIVVSER